MIWAVTGTRKGARPEQLVSVAWLFLEYGIRTLHDGDCIGVDKQVYHLGRAFGAQIVLHPPCNPRYRAYCSGAGDIRRPSKSYFARDEDMVNESRALVSVQWKPVEMNSGGTRYTTDYARSLKRPIALVWPHGLITYENWNLEKIR